MACASEQMNEFGFERELTIVRLLIAPSIVYQQLYEYRQLPVVVVDMS